MLENEYQSSRMVYNQSHSKEEKLNQEKVAELTDTSVSTIKRIESGEIIPNHKVVAKMGELYHDRKLLRNYCATHCEVGRSLHRKSSSDFKPNSLFEAGYGLITANKELESFRRELFDILADGRVDPDEVVRLKDVMENLEKVQEIIDVIKEMIRNHEGDS